jgi:hypothetical protein
MYRHLRSPYRCDFLISSAAANAIVAFIAALEEAELLYTAVSDTGTGVIIPSIGQRQINSGVIIAHQRLTMAAHLAAMEFTMAL